jgi:hypothetical protein
LSDPEAQKALAEAGWTASTITAGKVTGMIVEVATVEEINYYNMDRDALNELIIDCIEVLQADFNKPPVVVKITNSTIDASHPHYIANPFEGQFNWGDVC